MKIIEKISEFIDDEICGVKDYAKMAIELKSDYPMIAETFYDMSKDEAKHMNLLHEMVVKIIAKYREENGEPPADMLAVYDYLHKKQIEKALEVKSLQAMYKEG